MIELTPLVSLDGEPKVGQVIIFGFAIGESHRSPFGVGIILKIRTKGYCFQWLGNYVYNPTGAFERAWIDGKDRGYYGKRNGRDRMWTSDITDTTVREIDLIARGWPADLLEEPPSNRLTTLARALISKEVGKMVRWPSK